MGYQTWYPIVLEKTFMISIRASPLPKVIYFIDEPTLFSSLKKKKHWQEVICRIGTVSKTIYKLFSHVCIDCIIGLNYSSLPDSILSVLWFYRSVFYLGLDYGTYISQQDLSRKAVFWLFSYIFSIAMTFLWKATKFWSRFFFNS